VKAGPARRAWLAANVLAPRQEVELTIRYGDPLDVVPAVAGGGVVHVSAETTPYGRRRDRAVAETVELVATGSPYAVGPGLVTNGSGDPYQVFSAFARSWRARGWPAPADVPRSAGFLRPTRRRGRRHAPTRGGRGPCGAARCRGGGRLAALGGLPRPGPGGLPHRADRPDRDGTSRLSPYLHLGVLHPRSLLADLDPGSTFATELAWREFYADVLWHAPSSAWSDLRPGLSAMTYDAPEDAIEAWRPARRATRSWMPGCGRCARSAGCTTACE
jgi:deoxyribodipyrimidine photo-lyase